jgi:hypothetical protein
MTGPMQIGPYLSRLSTEAAARAVGVAHGNVIGESGKGTDRILQRQEAARLNKKRCIEGRGQRLGGLASHNCPMSGSFPGLPVVVDEETKKRHGRHCDGSATDGTRTTGLGSGHLPGTRSTTWKQPLERQLTATQGPPASRRRFGDS